MLITRRDFIRVAAAATGAASVGAMGKEWVGKKINFGIGPLLPSAQDTKTAYDPFFKYLAQQLGAAEYELAVTNDWAGIAVAMGSGQLDLAWMGPWGYVLAHNSTDCYVVATAKYDGRPIYHAIVIARPDIDLAKFPDDSKGLSISFADVGSTSGWLIPTYYAKEVWKIDPKSFWKYSEGASHAANEISVQAGQIDMATDYDRNRNAMIEGGKIKAASTKIVWTSADLPNDAIAVPKSASGEFADQVRKILTGISVEQAATLLPKHYDGFVAATHDAYLPIEKAGIAVGKLKPR